MASNQPSERIPTPSSQNADVQVSRPQPVLHEEKHTLSARWSGLKGLITGIFSPSGFIAGITGLAISIWTPVGDYLKNESQETKIFSDKMKEAVTDLSSQEPKDQKKAAMSLVTVYPLTDDLFPNREKEAKKILIKLALLNGSDPVLKALSGLVGKDEVAKEIISSEETSDLVRTSIAEVQLSNTERNFLLPGDSGKDVVALQAKLIEEGYLTGPPTGYFAAETVGAIYRFQLDNGFSADGIAGPATFELLGLESLVENRTVQVPDYQDSFNEESQSYRSILLKQAVSKGQTGWIYLGTYPESMEKDGNIVVNSDHVGKLEGSIIDPKTFLEKQIDAKKLTLATDVYLREHRPQSQRLGRTIGIVSKDSAVRIQQAYIYRATTSESRLWAKVKIESLPFDSSETSN